MNEVIMRELLQTIKDDMRPALGVTEPAAIALAAATARRAVGGEVKSVELALDAGVFKNGFSCQIPGTNVQGNALAALLGALAGDADKGLSALAGVNETDVERAEALEAAGAATVRMLEGLQEIRIDATVTTDKGVGRAVIERIHDNITLVEANGQAVSRKETSTPDTAPAPAAAQAQGFDVTELTLHDFYDFVQSVPAADIAFVLEAVAVNSELMEAGRNGAGMGVGATMAAMEKSGVLSSDAVSTAQISLAMAIDARMGGKPKAAMTICGSGDHGVICTMPLAALAKSSGASDDKLARSIAMSYLVTMYIKHYTGRLSAFCGCAVAAGTGMAAGAAYLMGGDEKAIAGTIDNMAANLTGMICDGGNLGCTLKAVSAAGIGVLSAQLAIAGVVIPPLSGIVGATVEETMRNIGRIANPGMLAVNNTILEIMRRDNV